MTTKQDRENRMILVAHLSRLYPDIAPHIIARDVAALGAIGARAHRHAERMCSEEGYYNAHTGPDGEDKTDARLQAKADKIAARYPGMRVDLGGDPRGYCCQIHVPGLKGNTWGGDESGYGLN